MKLQFACIAALFAALLAPVAAADLSALAPADEYFGKFQMSVLGIANTIRDSGRRVDEGADPQAMIGGPLAFATDAIVAWEHAYPHDPWIAKDLLALQTVYHHMHTPAADRLATQTAAWLARDENTRAPLTPMWPVAAPAAPANAAPSAWERFSALRAPIPPSR